MTLDKINEKNGWHDLRKNPNDLPAADIDVLIAWSNYYGDNGRIETEDYIRYVIATRTWLEQDEGVDEGYYWLDDDDNKYDGDIIAWHFLPPRFEAPK